MKVRALVRRGWLPLQHGAWSMTFVPLLIGVAMGGPQPAHLILLISWTVAFLFFNVFGLIIKAKRRERYRSATLTYGVIAAAGAAMLLARDPELWIWGPPLAILFLWAVVEIVRGNERSLGARVSAILASCLMMPVAYSLGSHPDSWHHLWIQTGIVALYFAGTVPYVKTLIRERGNRNWLIGSVGFHLLILIASVVGALAWPGSIGWMIPALWAVLLGRAVLYPWLSHRRGRPLDPKFVGISEFGFCALVVLAVLV